MEGKARCARADADVVIGIYNDSARLNGIRGPRDRLPRRENHTLHPNLQPPAGVVKRGCAKVEFNGETAIENLHVVDDDRRTHLIPARQRIPQHELEIEQAVGDLPVLIEFALIRELGVGRGDDDECAETDNKDCQKVSHSDHGFSLCVCMLLRGSSRSIQPNF